MMTDRDPRGEVDRTAYDSPSSPTGRSRSGIRALPLEILFAGFLYGGVLFVSDRHGLYSRLIGGTLALVCAALIFDFGRREALAPASRARAIAFLTQRIAIPLVLSLVVIAMVTDIL